jgi:hypothetical protein
MSPSTLGAYGGMTKNRRRKGKGSGTEVRHGQVVNVGRADLSSSTGAARSSSRTNGRLMLPAMWRPDVKDEKHSLRKAAASGKAAYGAQGSILVLAGSLWVPNLDNTNGTNGTRISHT